MNCPERQKKGSSGHAKAGINLCCVCHASLCLVDDISGAFIIFIHPTLEGEMNEDKASRRIVYLCESAVLT